MDYQNKGVLKLKVPTMNAQEFAVLFIALSWAFILVCYTQHKLACHYCGAKIVD